MRTCFLARGIFAIGVSEKHLFAYFCLLLTYSELLRSVSYYAAAPWLTVLPEFLEINNG